MKADELLKQYHRRKRLVAAHLSGAELEGANLSEADLSKSQPE